MSKDWKESTTSTLTLEEIEKLLANDYGDKLKPVDREKLAKQQQQRARSYDKKQNAVSNAIKTSEDS
jgi:hypothetical protein